jgi:hypothetical protein
MGGAILAELLMDAWILVDDTKKQHVTVVRCGHPGEPVLDRAVDKIRERKRKTSLKNWVTHLGNLSKLRHEVAAGLCRRGILREDEGRVLALFRRKLYPQIDPRPERQLIERLRRAIFTETSKVEPRTGVLIALAQATDLLSIPFEKKELKKRKKRIESIVNGELLGRATKEAVQAAAAAAMVAVRPTRCQASPRQASLNPRQERICKPPNGNMHVECRRGVWSWGGTHVFAR